MNEINESDTKAENDKSKRRKAGGITTGGDTISDNDKNKTKSASENSNVKPIEGPKEPFSFKKLFRSLVLFFTVEPYLLFYIIPTVLSSSAMQKFNLEKACRVDLDMSEEICVKVINGLADDNVTTRALTEATVILADMTAWRDPLQTGIPAIFIMFVGAWSDRTGNRKVVLLVPVIGEICSLILILLGTYFFLEWPLWIMGLIEASSSVFTGGFSVALMGSYSYLADVTTPEERTFRMGVLAVLVSLGIPLGTALSGVLTVSTGYYGIFGISLVMYMLGFIHTIFRIHDVKRKKNEGSFMYKVITFFHPRNVWETLSLLFTSRGRQLAQLLLVIWAHIVITGPVAGESACTYLYTLNRYSMDLVDFTLFITYNLIMGIVGSALATTIFIKWLKWHDAVVGIVSSVSKVMATLAYGLAPTRDFFYGAAAIDLFGNAAVIAIRSLGTKIVKPDQVGKMCSLIGFIDSIVPVIYVPMYTKLFSKTIDTVPGAIYFLGTIMTAPDIFVFLTLYIFHRKQQRDTVKNPEIKEMHVYENDVTAL